MALRCVNNINLVKNCRILLLQNYGKVSASTDYNSRAGYCNHVIVHAAPLTINKQKVSKAMKAYLERAQEHDEFMKAQHLEFELGKRHLANMMGEDPETFTQEDIDRAIEYLFPSGLHDPRARPQMKNPDEVFPARKAAEFDETGRPFHSMFYTGKPNFFKLLYDIVEEMNKLYEHDERMLRRGNKPDPNQKIDLSGFNWLPKDQLEDTLMEKIADIEYSNFKNAMDRLVSLPYSYRCKEFIDKYTKPLLDQSKKLDIPEPKYDDKGRQYVTTTDCMRKSARGSVTIFSPGEGNITINGQDIMYFENIQCREQVLYPLIFSDMLGKVDIEAVVTGGGPSGQAGAVRWGIATGLRSFVDQEMIEAMRLAGLLTRDWRCRERKKYGQEGARRKYTWKKR